MYFYALLWGGVKEREAAERGRKGERKGGQRGRSATVHMWRSEHNYVQLLLCFLLYVGSRGSKSGHWSYSNASLPAVSSI